MYTSGVRLIHLLQIHDSLPPRSLISIHLIFSLRHAFLEEEAEAEAEAEASA